MEFIFVAPGGLLLSTLVPIPKNKRENKTDSNNYYRAIAISSLLGKLFELIVLSEQSSRFETDNLDSRNILLLFIQCITNGNYRILS